MYKTAQTTPLLKDPNLNSTSPADGRPTSNLPTASKVIGRAIRMQLQTRITDNQNYSSHQPAYRPNHSTETALFHVLDDVYQGCDDKTASILTSLDLSAAFDTRDHNILIVRLNFEYGIEGLALKWLESYLTGRKQFVKLGTHTSSAVSIEHGVPQGSVFGPLLFTTYPSPIGSIPNSSSLTYHQYADDTKIIQKITSYNPLDSTTTLTDCTKSVGRWFLQNKLHSTPPRLKLSTLVPHNTSRDCPVLQTSTFAPPPSTSMKHSRCSASPLTMNYHSIST